MIVCRLVFINSEYKAKLENIQYKLYLLIKISTHKFTNEFLDNTIYKLWCGVTIIDTVNYKLFKTVYYESLQ